MNPNTDAVVNNTHLKALMLMASNTGKVVVDVDAGTVHFLHETNGVQVISDDVAQHFLKAQRSLLQA